jgi:hypothetical protein
VLVPATVPETPRVEPAATTIIGPTQPVASMDTRWAAPLLWAIGGVFALAALSGVIGARGRADDSETGASHH